MTWFPIAPEFCPLNDRDLWKAWSKRRLSPWEHDPRIYDVLGVLLAWQ
jgi:hypothetical protein